MKEPDAGRLLSADAFRGAVLLLLIPDVFGAFSFYKMAQRFPDDPVWDFLARLFTHVKWGGCSIWDLVLPSFLLLIGLSIPYSDAARKRQGQSDTWILTHATLRALALLLLAVVVQIPIRTIGDMIWPLWLLAFGLPLSGFVAAVAGDRVRAHKDAIDLAWWITVLAVTAVHLLLDFQKVDDFALNEILSEVGLGYVFVYLLAGRRRAIQAGAIAVILFGYWLAFVLYPLPPPGLDLAQVGAAPGDEIFQGFFAHWNKGTNVAAAFDSWFLNIFPRPQPYVFNSHGYQTLSFIPAAVTMIVGLMAGEYLRTGRARTELRNGLFKAGGVLLGGGLLAGWTLTPIVKSIYTPSWTLFSSGCALALFAVFYHVIEVRHRRAWSFPLVVAGANPILLYILALKYRWWILEIWRRGLRSSWGPWWFGLSWTPILESLLFVVSLWMLALLLYRMKFSIRL